MGNSSTVASTHCVIGPNIEAENLNRNIMFGGLRLGLGLGLAFLGKLGFNYVLG